MLAAVAGVVTILLGIMGVKYGLEAILVGLTFIGIACGLKKE